MSSRATLSRTCVAAALTVAAATAAPVTASTTTSSAQASAAPARTAVLTADAQHVSWRGSRATGLDVSPALRQQGIDQGRFCGDPGFACDDDTLLELDVAETSDTTTLVFRIEDFGKATDDFDLWVYESNAAGDRGRAVGHARGDIASQSPLGAGDPRHLGVGDHETTRITGVRPGSHYLVRVVYRSVVDSDYRGVVSVSGLPPQPR